MSGTEIPDPPHHLLGAADLDDLELVLGGALPAELAFAGAGAGGDGRAHIAVPVEAGRQASRCGVLVLTDEEGAPRATIKVDAVTEQGEAATVSGTVLGRGTPPRGAFHQLRRAPSEVRARRGEACLGVPVDGPLTRADLDAIAAAAGGAPVLLLAMTGHASPRSVSARGLVHATVAAAQLLPDAEVVVVPLASRGDAHRDAVRRRSVVRAYTLDRALEVAGQGELPATVSALVERDRPRRHEQGLVVLFTGLSGSGKSTLARAFEDLLIEHGDRTATLLDGDVVRRRLSTGLGFSAADRETNLLRIAWVAGEISRHRGVAICCPIAPFEEVRREMRQIVEDAGGAFFLVHVATPLEECERRDRKGHYARARQGLIPDFTGISSPYHEPVDADVRVDTTDRSIDDALAEVVAGLRAAGLLPDLARTPTIEPVKSPPNEE